MRPGPMVTARHVTRPMVVAGVMSGTSADGVDVAFCRISPGREAEVPVHVRFLGHRSFPYDKRLRGAILAAAGGQPFAAATFAQLGWRLGAFYADCIAAAAQSLELAPQLVAMHGQTMHHQAIASRYLGHATRSTWQIGEPAVVSERLRVPVVSDLRPADFAAGGQGAPLVPMLDFCMFRHSKKNRLLLNLGGIANVTVLPAGCTTNEVLAFDTGPANMVIDALMQQLYARRLDKGGSVAARGTVLQDVVKHLLGAAYFLAAPPKSCGREEFGAAFVERFLKRCGAVARQDVIATAAGFAAASIADAITRFCMPRMRPGATELFASGGGGHNRALMTMLRDRLAPLNIKVGTTAPAGLPVEAKEAAAFALLGWLTCHGLPGNLPSATGAGRSVVLGKISLP